MLAHDAAGSDDASVTNAQKICDIIIVDLNNREIPIKVSPPSGTTQTKSSACLTRQGQEGALEFYLPSALSFATNLLLMGSFLALFLRLSASNISHV